MNNEVVAEVNPSNPYFVRLDVFEGPLDLLLHLIKEEKVDIYDISISRITDQYISYLEMMRELNLDVAGEFLVMAASLAHLKSRMLLPPDASQDDPEEEGVDPRAELIRRLLEYQKYKNAAELLHARPLLGRDVFKREKSERPAHLESTGAQVELADVSVFKLVEAFSRILTHLKLVKPHQVWRENISVHDRVTVIRNAIKKSHEGTVRFDDLFQDAPSRQVVIVTFIAVLEMLKRGYLSVFQAEQFSDIQLMGTHLLYDSGDWTYDGNDEYQQQPQA